MESPTLEFRDRRTGERRKKQGDRIVLDGRCEWLLSGAPDEIKQVKKAIPKVSEQLGPGLLLLNFGNQVGRVRLEGLPPIEVISGKWDDRHFERMLAELTKVAAGLPFSAGAVTALPYERSVAAREEVIYHAFVYLRSILSEHAPREVQLMPALHTVLRDPHRRFERVRRLVPIEAVRRLDPAAMTRMVTGQQKLVRLGSSPLSHLPLAVALHGHLPEQIEEGQVEVTHDTPENRFVKTFLREALYVIDSIRREFEHRRDGHFRARVEADCADMERKLRPVEQHALWTEVGKMTHFPAASTVLQRRRGYREILRHSVKLRLAARVLMTKELVQELLEAKNIALLYELWCYFSMVGQLRNLLGKPRTIGRPEIGKTEITVPHQFEVAWKDGPCLRYNPTFSRSQAARSRSYSVPLRADISLQISGGPNKGLHLLDAKFRVDKLDEIMPGNGREAKSSEDLKEQERCGTFKRGDLYKMHTYRDAITGARSVWILYPGTTFKFYGIEGQTVSTPAALPEVAEGVGAIPLMPDEDDHNQLRSALVQLLRPTMQPGGH